MHEAEEGRAAPSTPRWSRRVSSSSPRESSETLTPTAPAQPEKEAEDKLTSFDEQTGGVEPSVHVKPTTDQRGAASAGPTVHFKSATVNPTPASFMTAPLPRDI